MKIPLMANRNLTKIQPGWRSSSIWTKSSLDYCISNHHNPIWILYRTKRKYPSELILKKILSILLWTFKMWSDLDIYITFFSLKIAQNILVLKKLSPSQNMYRKQFHYKKIKPKPHLLPLNMYNYKNIKVKKLLFSVKLNISTWERLVHFEEITIILIKRAYDDEDESNKIYRRGIFERKKIISIFSQK
jgi:hypothetical protein